MSITLALSLCFGLSLAAFVGGYGHAPRRDGARIADLERIHAQDMQTSEDLEAVVDAFSDGPVTDDELDRMLDELVVEANAQT